MNRPRRTAPKAQARKAAQTGDAMNRVSTIYNMYAGMGGDERSG